MSLKKKVRVGIAVATLVAVAGAAVGIVATRPEAVGEALVTADTNCRAGPSLSADILGVVLAGETVKVFDFDDGVYGAYWLVKNPDAGGLCWMWNNFAVNAAP